MLFIYRIIAVTFVVCVLPACGQKGPLFLAPQSVPYSLLPSATAAPLPAAPASAAK
ncbi:MAG: lipoprotein [Polaromonas sp.]